MISIVFNNVYYDLRNETRNIKVVNFNASRFPIKEIPSDADIEKKLKNDSSLYQKPEYRSFSFISIKPDNLIDQIIVTEEEMQNEYNNYPEKYNVAEKREVFLANFKDEKDAQEIADKIKNGSPSTLVFIQTILPINNQHYMNIKNVNYNFLLPDFNPSINTQIEEVNSILINNNKHPVIDLHSLFLNSDDILEPKFSSDGLHLNKKGYQIWAGRISPIIMTLNTK